MCRHDNSYLGIYTVTDFLSELQEIVITGVCTLHSNFVVKFCSLSIACDLKQMNA